MENGDTSLEPQARTRRHKRPSPTDANSDASKLLKKCRKSDTSKFHVEIPKYYYGYVNEQIESIEGGDSLSVDDSAGSVAQDGKKLSSTSTGQEQAAVAEQAKEGTALDEKNISAKKHDEFISALEKYGSYPSGAWNAMASDLGWAVDKVKVYAYKYFKTLATRHGNTKRSCDSLCFGKNGAKNVSNTGGKVSTSWSVHELILLDALMVKYCKDSSCLDAEGNRSERTNNAYSDRNRTPWEQIAANLPGKTALACREKGTSRLSNFGLTTLM
mmetsp:Transcript_39488/g.83041  ORF Transcript_39488/g.83041 Transcript_39488/m.83041 type:complete len:272 (-) Transcript_39488:45-860(-)